LLFAAETTGALVVPTPTRAFFFFLDLISVSRSMKTLFLLRHARAANAASGSSDLARNLNERGREQARAVGKFIIEKRLTVDLALCSPAARARETTDLVVAAAGLSCSVSYDERIYEAGPLRLVEVISEIAEDANAVLLVGHNPGMEELLKLLTGRAEHMGTATLARIDLSGNEWGKAGACAAGLEWVMNPNEISQSSS
jgi:phosphohistidine phosphatase